MWSGNIKINLTKTAILLFLVKALLDCQNPYFIEVPKNLDYFCIAVGVGVFLVKMIHNNFTLKSFLTFVGIGSLLFVCCSAIQGYDLLISFITIYLLKDEDFDEYVELLLRAQAFLMVVIFLWVTIRNLGNLEQLYWSVLDGRVRFTAGMVHPNLFSVYVLTNIMMYVWLNFENMTTKKYLGIIIATCISFALTDTRTTFIISIIFIILLYFANNSLLQKFYKKYLKYMFPGLGLLMGYLIVNYSTGAMWIQKVDSWITGRIKLGAYAYYRSGMTIFPRYLDYSQTGFIEWQPEWGLNGFTFDNLYSYIWVQLGVVFFVFCTVVLWKLIKETDYKCHLFIFMWIIYGITEVHGVNCYRCFPLLLTVMLLQKRKVKKLNT